MNLTFKNISLGLAAIVLFSLPLIMLPNADFSGSDDRAEQLVQQIAPDYQPWFHSLWRPSGGSVETLLFSLQAALGSGIVFYYLGYRKGLAKGKVEDQDAGN